MDAPCLVGTHDGTQIAKPVVPTGEPLLRPRAWLRVGSCVGADLFADWPDVEAMLALAVGAVGDPDRSIWLGCDGGANQVLARPRDGNRRTPLPVLVGLHEELIAKLRRVQRLEARRLLLVVRLLDPP